MDSPAGTYPALVSTANHNRALALTPSHLCPPYAPSVDTYRSTRYQPMRDTRFPYTVVSIGSALCHRQRVLLPVVHRQSPRPHRPGGACIAAPDIQFPFPSRRYLFPKTRLLPALIPAIAPAVTVWDQHGSLQIKKGRISPTLSTTLTYGQECYIADIPAVKDNLLLPCLVAFIASCPVASCSIIL